ncbi:rhamnulokinase family protein [Haladaptatus sp. DYF46]|uniref:rhamnulokinase n=1 Tax=Haladaptatus sp. DYF46 TaxID=2886041 RepID=UPI001E2F9254|nr:rhamnulokinase family protein [Haladaptatus sp. DYF46]
MKHVAVDIGANGGTVFAGSIETGRLDVAEIYRFDNRPTETDGRYVWELSRLLDDIETGLSLAAEELDGVDTVGIDTWGLDFGLLRDGEPMGDPYSYRDPAVIETRDAIIDAVGKRSIFDATGLNHWNTPNTLWQYHALAENEPDRLADADRLLMMPQLLTYLLGGDPVTEVTVASTTQMLDPERRAWNTDLLDDLSLPTEPLPPLREPGSTAGTVSAEYLPSEPELVLPASHDTAAAVAGMPLSDGTAFLSTGSWFILGLVTSQPNRSAAAYEAGLSNELGFDHTVRLLKNVNGFFLLEECRWAWEERGESASYEELIAAARDVPARKTLVDPDAETFSIDGEMPERIADYCRETEQPIPETKGETVRCLLDSLAVKTAVALDEIASVTGRDPSTLHVGGGGVRNELFCRTLADATGRVVRAGPTEATATGNLLTQAVAAGSLPDLETGRELVEATTNIRTYEPTGGGWDDAKTTMRELASR